MKKSRAELKLMAKQALMGNYGVAVGAILILGSAMVGLVFILYFVLLAFIMSIAIGANSTYTGAGVGMSVGMIIFLIVFMLALYLLEYLVIPGVMRIYCNLCTGRQAKIEDLFFAFRNNFKKFFGVAIVLVVSILLMAILQWVISFVGGGIALSVYIVLLMVFSFYISLNFGLFYFALVEDPSVKVMDALKNSLKYMKGNKWRLFVLYLSFIGWMLLSYLTCYIALLWVIPYMSCTMFFFYLDVKAEHEPAEDSAGMLDFETEFHDISSKENADA